MKWLQEKLIPNLESKSVIVVDNMSYHNEQLNQHPVICTLALFSYPD